MIKFIALSLTITILLIQNTSTMAGTASSKTEETLPDSTEINIIAAPGDVYLPIVQNGESLDGVSSPEAALAEWEQYQDTPTITGTTYYVANNGDDDNNGTSLNTPWQTIAKVNGETFSPGDGILFKRGDTWREMLIINSSGTESNPITYAAYGTGQAPAILGSTAVTTWTQISGNVWRGNTPVADPSRGAPHDGQQNGTGGWPGTAYFVALDGTVHWGNQEKYLSGGFQDLQRHYDWGWRDGYVYIYSVGNPNTRWSALEVTQRASSIEMPSNNPQDWVVIDNIQMLYTQAKGFFSGYPAMAAEGLTISNCHVGWVGIKGGLAADGLKVWHSNSTFKNNVVHDTGRHGAGVLPFGGSVNQISNVTFDNNTFYNGFHTTGVDLQVANANSMDNIIFINNQFLGSPDFDLGGEEAFNSNHIWTDPGSGNFTNFKFINNIFTYCHGKCLAINNINGTEVYHNTFYGVNPTLANTQGQLYYIGSIQNSTVRNNIFYNNVDTSFNSSFYGIKANNYQMAEIDMDYNLFYTTDPNAPMVKVIEFSGAYQMDEWETYKAETGWDAHSPTPQNPLFAAPNNYHLRANSPAKGAGTYIGFAPMDRDGNTRTNPPSIGVYE